MKRYLLNSPLQSDEATMAQVAEQVLNQAVQNFRIQKLRESIDQALCERNKQEFMRLTEELKAIYDEE